MLKRSLFILFILSQLSFNIVSAKQNTLEQTLSLLWNSLSREPNSKPNIKSLDVLLHDNATIFRSTYKDKDPILNALSKTDFIEAVNQISTEGFYECEIARKIKKWDRFAHVFSIVESRSEKSQEQPDYVGINSIQLYKYNDQWKILSLYYHIPEDSAELTYDKSRTGNCFY